MNDRSAMKKLFLSTQLIVMVPCMICCGCSGWKEKKIRSAEQVIEASLHAAGTETARKAVSNMISIANCSSPGGSYTTEIHTALDGYSYFKQTYSYKPNAYEAVIFSKTSGVQLMDPGSQLNREAIYTIRGHAFINMILEVDQRFRNFQEPEIVEAGSVKSYRLRATDELDHPCYLFFDRETDLFTALHFQDPVHEKETIVIKFSGWKKVQDLQVPHHVEINQGDKVFTFDMVKIIFNDPGFRKKEVHEKN